MMSRQRARGILAVVALSLSALMLSGGGAAADADDDDRSRFRAALRPVPHDPDADNGSKVAGKARLVKRDGNRLRARIRAHGLDPLPHAMHIHGPNHPEIASCPGSEARNDLVDDGLIETLEGLEDYGPILVSFTTRGDTSPASALALERFPVASQDGELTYKRTLSIPRDVARRLGDLHIVVHGEDLNDNGRYDGRVTELGAPLEAELPVACGTISAVESDDDDHDDDNNGDDDHNGDDD